MAPPGTPYFLVSIKDKSLKQDVDKHPVFSLTVSQAQVDCALHGRDPQDPRCARLTVTGTMELVTALPEQIFAKAAMLKKHPSMAEWMRMSDWGFGVYKML